MSDILPLDLTRLKAAYATGALSPSRLVDALLPRLAASDGDAVWIARVPADTLRARAAALEAMPPAERGPLWGVPFAVKDNIDVAGLPTTAACPAFAYTPKRSATVVDRLVAAGAILVGKTNLDQFATGPGRRALALRRRPQPVRRRPSSPAAPARARRWRSRPVWSASRSAPTRRAPAGCRRRSPTSSASSRPRA